MGNKFSPFPGMMMGLGKRSQLSLYPDYMNRMMDGKIGKTLFFRSENSCGSYDHRDNRKGLVRHEKSSKPSAVAISKYLKFPQIDTFKFPQKPMICDQKYLFFSF